MINYTVRRSSRSHRVRLSVTAREGLVIVVPHYFDLSRLPKIVANKEKWIERAVRKVKSAPAHLSAPIVLPGKIYLRSIDIEYSISIEYHSHRKNILSVNGNSIMLSLNRNSSKAGFVLLKKWIDEKAKEILLPWLQRYSTAHQLPYHSAAIRTQRTRWGSCSAKKNISLNRLLIFFPSHLVEYLFIHELCHTIEMNHSKRYWSLVKLYCPEYKSIDKELKNASRFLERWVYK